MKTIATSLTMASFQQITLMEIKLFCAMVFLEASSLEHLLSIFMTSTEMCTLLGLQF